MFIRTNSQTTNIFHEALNSFRLTLHIVLAADKSAELIISVTGLVVSARSGQFSARCALLSVFVFITFDLRGCILL